MSDVWFTMFDLRCPMSDVLMSDFRCPMSDFRLPISDVRCQIFDVGCPMSFVWCLNCFWVWSFMLMKLKQSKIKLTWDNKLSTTYMTFSYLFFFLTGLNFLTQLILITINEEEPAGRWIFVVLLLFIILKCHGQFLLFTKISCSYLRLYKVFHRKVRGILLLLISLRMASLLLIAS